MTTIVTNVINKVAYLRTSRNFPKNIEELSVELDKTYIDIANAVNSRTISLFPKNRPAINGEAWFLNNDQKQQGFRQVYTFTSAGSIAHAINFSEIYGFTRIYGTFTNGTNWYPLPYVDVVAANNQVNVIVDPTNIVITGGGGGSQPAITSGFVVLEWIAKTVNR